MTEAKDQLAAFWRETEAPARDLIFELGVEQAIARRRLAIELANVGAASLAVGAVLLLLAPVVLQAVNALAPSLDAAGPVLAAAAAIGGAMVWLGRDEETLLL